MLPEIGKTTLPAGCLWTSNPALTPQMMRCSQCIRTGLVPARSPSSDCMSGLCLSRSSEIDKGASRRCSFCGSTVDQRKPDRDLDLKDCAPGIPCWKNVQAFLGTGWLTSCSNHEPSGCAHIFLVVLGLHFVETVLMVSLRQDESLDSISWLGRRKLMR